MSAVDTIEEAALLGITLRAVGDTIMFWPASAATPEFVARLREDKRHLLDYLHSDAYGLPTHEVHILLGWASTIAEQNIELDSPVRYSETRLRPVTTARVSHYARQYLQGIAFARMHQQVGSWDPWTSDWWRARERDGIEALSGLRAAMEARDG